jgi:hypothetical protein
LLLVQIGKLSSSQLVNFNNTTVSDYVQKALQLVLLLVFLGFSRCTLRSLKVFNPEIDSSEVHIDLEWRQNTSSEMSARGDLVIFQYVIINHFSSDLL